ncbi:hypothetical protein GCM10007854_13650 [Algimonas porphyrae]|uniref:Uncharacterized protein n=1 Tax=Algimonas porphyrae TaxID=1128113 RepID=A0ABQ5V072_9PROT|nr:hypothetical protein GCM10007854_13650 [Algimonas porphyrae]
MDRDCPRLELDPKLKQIQPITPTPSTEETGGVEDALVIVSADHGRDRGQLKQVVAADDQRARDQAVLDAQCAKSAADQARIIEAASKETVKVRVPFWRRLGL